MRIKDGVQIAGIQPQILVALMVAKEEYDKLNTELVLTSVLDGVHSANSKHYSGNAVDLRTRTLPDPRQNGQALANQIGENLGREFDVIFEGDHIHIEYDPRKPL